MAAGERPFFFSAFGMEKEEKMIRIRPVEHGDLPKVREMIAALASHHGEGALVTVADLRRDLFGPTPWLKMLVAEDDGTCVGYAAMGRRAKLGDGLRGIEVEHLYVDADRRGRGLGRRMLAAVEASARRLGSSFVTIGTQAENVAARGAYVACGYEPLPHDPNRLRKRLA